MKLRAQSEARLSRIRLVEMARSISMNPLTDKTTRTYEMRRLRQCDAQSAPAVYQHVLREAIEDDDCLLIVRLPRTLASQLGT